VNIISDSSTIIVGSVLRIIQDYSAWLMPLYPT